MALYTVSDAFDPVSTAFDEIEVANYGVVVAVDAVELSEQCVIASLDVVGLTLLKFRSVGSVQVGVSAQNRPDTLANI